MLCVYITAPTNASFYSCVWFMFQIEPEGGRVPRTAASGLMLWSRAGVRPRGHVRPENSCGPALPKRWGELIKCSTKQSS